MSKYADFKVKDAMNRKLVYTSPNETVLNAVKEMLKYKVGSILVIDKGKLIGILTEKDIIAKIVALNWNPEKMTVSKIMSKNVLSGTPDMELTAAARMMIDLKIRKLPVINKGKVVGMLTSTDILRIAPGLIDILSETIKADLPSVSRSAGICDVCNAYSRNLKSRSGVQVCPHCMRGKDLNLN